MKKSDIIDNGTCETTGAQYCSDCPDYDTCDNCGRRVCKYISVIVADDEKEYCDERDFDGELWCRYCCKEAGFSTSEIESGKVRL